MILSNQRHCTKCGDKPFSRTRHDYQECSCGKVMVDGGQDYLRQSVNGESMNIVISDEHYEGLEKVLLSRWQMLSPLGVICHLALYLRDEMGINIGADDEQV